VHTLPVVTHLEGCIIPHNRVVEELDIALVIGGQKVPATWNAVGTLLLGGFVNANCSILHFTRLGVCQPEGKGGRDRKGNGSSMVNKNAIGGSK